MSERDLNIRVTPYGGTERVCMDKIRGVFLRVWSTFSKKASLRSMAESIKEELRLEVSINIWLLVVVGCRIQRSGMCVQVSNFTQL